MTKYKPTLYAIDDDASVRRSLNRLLCIHGFRVEIFSRAADFMLLSELRRPSCLLLDIQLPDLSGINLQKVMLEKGFTIPIIFITGHGDIAMSVKAMKAGAVDFLTKPFSAKGLLEAIDRALARDKEMFLKEIRVAQTLERIRSLTAREMDVLMQVIKGLTNKEIASELGIALKTVKIHRGRVMKKMKAPSVIALAQTAREAGLGE